MINLLFAILRILVIPFGYLFMAYGEYTHRLKWLAFGNYITCTGRRLRVPAWGIEKIQKELANEEITTHKELAQWYVFNQYGEGEKDVYNTFGKTRIHNHRIFDIYQFYATCSNDDSHWINCHCEKKTWNHYNAIYKTFPHDSRFYKIIQRICTKSDFSYRTLQIENDYFEFRLVASYIDLTFSDKFFSKLGKRFAITATLPVKEYTPAYIRGKELTLSDYIEGEE